MTRLDDWPAPRPSGLGSNPERFLRVRGWGRVLSPEFWYAGPPEILAVVDKQACTYLPAVVPVGEHVPPHVFTQVLEHSWAGIERLFDAVPDQVHVARYEALRAWPYGFGRQLDVFDQAIHAARTVEQVRRILEQALDPYGLERGLHAWDRGLGTLRLVPARSATDSALAVFDAGVAGVKGKPVPEPRPVWTEADQREWTAMRRAACEADGHWFDEQSILNPVTGRPYGPGPLWAGTEPMDYPDPRCVCGELWFDDDGGCQSGKQL